MVNLSPRTEDLVLRMWEGLLGLKPMIVRVSEDAEMLAGVEVKAYIGGQRVMPKSVLSGERARNKLR